MLREQHLIIVHVNMIVMKMQNPSVHRNTPVQKCFNSCTVKYHLVVSCVCITTQTVFSKLFIKSVVFVLLMSILKFEIQKKETK